MFIALWKSSLIMFQLRQMWSLIPLSAVSAIALQLESN